MFKKAISFHNRIIAPVLALACAVCLLPIHIRAEGEESAEAPTRAIAAEENLPAAPEEVGETEKKEESAETASCSAAGVEQSGEDALGGTPKTEPEPQPAEANPEESAEDTEKEQNQPSEQGEQEEPLPQSEAEAIPQEPASQTEEENNEAPAEQSETEQTEADTPSAVPAVYALISERELIEGILYLSVGEQARLSLPPEMEGQSVQWQSTEADTVSVSSTGEITAQRAGTAIISAAGETASAVLTVTAEAATKQLTAEEQQPEYTGIPEFTVEWDTNISCGTPTTFTLNVTGVDPAKCKYYLNIITTETPLENREMLFDPSRTASPYNGYRTTNTFDFTFYASGEYEAKFYVMYLPGDAPVTVIYKTVTVTVDDPDYPSLAKICEDVVSECKSKVSGDWNIALWLHNWLIKNCKYNTPMVWCGAEGALARGTGTCESYHRAYCMLLGEAGIPYGRITGNGHVWTAVKLGGKWCQVDVTWDDDGYSPEGSDNQFLYFGLNDAITTLVHSEHTPHSGYVSDTLENNYFIRTGKALQWAEAFITPIREQIAAGARTFTLDVVSAEPKSLLDVKYNLAAYYLSKNITEDSNGNPCTIICGYKDKVLSVTANTVPGGTENPGTGETENTPAPTATPTPAPTPAPTATPTPIPTPAQELAAVNGLTVERDGTCALLTWQAVSGAQGYVIYRQVSSGAYRMLAIVNNGSAPSYRDSALTPGTCYGYKVVAKNEVGQEGDSEAAEAQQLVMPMQKPVITLKRVNSNTAVRVSWKAVPGAQEYIVYVDNGSGYDSGTVVTGTSCTRPVTVFRTARIRVLAISADGVTSTSDAKNSAGSAPTPALSVKASGATLSVKWKKVKYAAAYYVFVNGILQKTVSAAEAPQLILPIAPSGSYTVNLIAADSFGSLSKRASKTVKTTMKAPSVSLKAQSADSVTIRWSRVSGAAEYIVERASSPEGPWQQVTKLTDPAVKSNYAITETVSPGERHYYRVQAAWDGIELGTAAQRTVVSAVRSITLPFKVSKPTVKAVRTSAGKDLMVKWKAVKGATGYRLEITSVAPDGTRQNLASYSGSDLTYRIPMHTGTGYRYAVTLTALWQKNNSSAESGKVTVSCKG